MRNLWPLSVLIALSQQMSRLFHAHRFTFRIRNGGLRREEDPFAQDPVPDDAETRQREEEDGGRLARLRHGTRPPTNGQWSRSYAIQYL